MDPTILQALIQTLSQVQAQQQSSATSSPTVSRSSSGISASSIGSHGSSTPLSRSSSGVSVDFTDSPAESAWELSKMRRQLKAKWYRNKVRCRLHQELDEKYLAPRVSSLFRREAKNERGPNGEIFQKICRTL